MPLDPFAPTAKMAPYWWDRTPRPAPMASDLPRAVDVVVIGSGYTGLSAALMTARGGRTTLVLDAEDAGWGCSTRNGGQISTSIKPGYDELVRRHGANTAFHIVKDGHDSLAWISEFVAREQIDCDFRVVGRFHAAHGPRHYQALAERLRHQPKGLEIAAHMVPRSEQHGELGTETYHGGIVYQRHASVDPARLHQGMLDRALAAGADVVANCRANRIKPNGKGFHVETGRGLVAARNVVVATNGYTGELTPWLRRRVIPIGSYIIATEPLAQETMVRLMPKDRVISDTRKVVYYYRASPDRTRILFGGRVSASEQDPRITGPRLHTEMVRIFPELVDTRISHSWAGFVAYTFDELMHVGEHEGVHYAMGYCGSGAGMAGYLGMRIGQQVLGLSAGHTGLNAVSFPSRPFYRGDPWFLAPTVAYYRWRDTIGA
jgi:glycine/D-amino acid oxidase-like deaminating enzyme